ncbi:MAG TPA: hydroxymethylbilane synthase [Chitinophagaceae bacterium]|nr:hydroxymethylbilane synthase [Chitinophagaceae bacterium]
MKNAIKIGTRDSQLAVWQATLVQQLLQKNNIPSELIYIKSEGDVDTITPLYELGVQGIFTRSLDTALLNNRIDIAVHSLKDVPTKPATGIDIIAVLKRHSHKDILVFNGDESAVKEILGYDHGQWSSQKSNHQKPFVIATSSIRRIAQWKNRYPAHTFENLRGNVNTRLRKVKENNWNGAIFAAAGLERIQVRPENSIDLDWMLPAPAQGAIGITCRSNDAVTGGICRKLNDEETQLCTQAERDFLRTLLGGCSTPISALATINNGVIHFTGNICSADGKQKIQVEKTASVQGRYEIGIAAANELLKNEQARTILYNLRNAEK